MAIKHIFDIQRWRSRVHTMARPVRAAFSPRRKTASFAIPVLAYHSHVLDSGQYDGNDQLALASDLMSLLQRGYRVLPLSVLVDVLRGTINPAQLHSQKLVCLSLDDGTDHDYYSLRDERCGKMEGAHQIFTRFQPRLRCDFNGSYATAFVIASPDARKTLDRRCGGNRDQWRDEWWSRCAAGNILGIANHSWDHVHELLPQVCQCDDIRSSFFAIDTFDDAEAQIAQAQRYIMQQSQQQALPLFAYPYGHVNGYLRDEYFPQHGERIGIKGAFSCAPHPVCPDCNPWQIPRYVRGDHWKTPEDFQTLLNDIEHTHV